MTYIVTLFIGGQVFEYEVEHLEPPLTESGSIAYNVNDEPKPQSPPFTADVIICWKRKDDTVVDEQ